MQKPHWSPLILSGALPREFVDLLTIAIIGLVASLSHLSQASVAGVELGQVILFLTVPPVCMLASFTNSSSKLREELAILAYGGSSRQVLAQHFLRGFTCSLVALSPFLLFGILTEKGSLSTLSMALTAAAGGVFYLAPSLRRIRSPEFMEHYKA